MRLLIQRVKESKVYVAGEKIAQIDKGLLVLVGIRKGDKPVDIERLARKLIGLRIFEDTNGKMNLNIQETKGSLLSVPQFTLYADTKKGNRPGFDLSASPDIAKECWEKFNSFLKDSGLPVEKGIFGSHMEVELINDGPVTILLDSEI